MGNRYRKRPTIIDAVLYDGTNFGELVVFTGGSVRQAEPADDAPKGAVIVSTPTGPSPLPVGHWLARQPLASTGGATWDFWPIDADQFAASYDAVPEDEDDRPVGPVPPYSPDRSVVEYVESDGNITADEYRDAVNIDPRDDSMFTLALAPGLSWRQAVLLMLAIGLIVGLTASAGLFAIRGGP